MMHLKNAKISDQPGLRQSLTAMIGNVSALAREIQNLVTFRRADGRIRDVWESWVGRRHDLDLLSSGDVPSLSIMPQDT